jgi:parvulin-like peptidyl-prolyl isomerase
MKRFGNMAAVTHMAARGNVLHLALLAALLAGSAGLVRAQPSPGAAAASPHGTRAAPSVAEQRDPTVVADPLATFAVVDGTVIRAGDFQRALQIAVRNKYYHAKPPEADLARLKREIGDQVVNRVLLRQEAARRGITPDAQRIAAEVAGYDARYGNSPTWQTSRTKMLAGVLPQLEDDSRLERLSAQVRQAAEPSGAQLAAYYDAHRELFVEPERLKLSVILLKVEPSSPQAVWDAAHTEAAAIHRRLLGGADFGDLARLHSSDRSASSGGALEYTHRGMLPEAVHGLVDALAISAVGMPVQLLEGVAILRLDDRRPALQRRLDEVTPRCIELWKRDTAQAQWQALIDSLRQRAAIRIDESHYGALRGPGESAG